MSEKKSLRSVLNNGDGDNGGDGGAVPTSTPTAFPFTFQGVSSPNPARYWLAILNSNDGISYTRYLYAICSERFSKFEI